MAPHGRAFYSVTALFALLAGAVFMWGMFVSGSFPVASRLFGVFLVIVLYLGALQSLERLLRPEKARDRTAALSGSTRDKLRVVCKAMTTTFYAGWYVSVAMRLIDREHLRDLAGNISAVGWVFLLIGACLADLNGERLFYPYRAKSA
jgi:hypothetical protein